MAALEQKTVGIIGAAIAGPTLALQILSHPSLRKRFKPVLFDAAPKPRTDPEAQRLRAGASVGLFANGLFPLQELGLDDAVKAHGFECSDIYVWQSYLDGRKGEKLNGQKKALWSANLNQGVWYFERSELQALLLERLSEIGGDEGQVQWGKKAVRFQSQVPKHTTRVDFEDGSSAEVDLLVGADGGYSAVRRHILEQKDPSTAEARWLPDFLGMTGIYGVSGAPQAKDAEAEFSDTHAIWLDRGFLASGPCPGGKTRWDLILPEAQAPDHNGTKQVPDRAGKAKEWESKILPSQYPLSDTSEILRKHKDVHHPLAGSMASLYDTADRIIRSPLRQRVWKTDEIHHGSVVLIGDAARLLLPTSGQGTGFAIEDATVLADMLVKHEFTGSEGGVDSLRSALEEYARLRVPRSTRMATFASAVGQLGLGAAWYYRTLRYYMYKWLPSWTDDKPRYSKDPWPTDGRFSVRGTP